MYLRDMSLPASQVAKSAPGPAPIQLQCRKGLFGITSIFVDLSETMAEFGFLVSLLGSMFLLVELTMTVLLSAGFGSSNCCFHSAVL